MSGILWLASYPRSGNTWLRAFLANLTAEGNRPADINSDLGFAPIASSRRIFDDLVGVEASELTDDEINRLRPKVYRELARRSENTVFLKIHDARRTNTGIDLTADAGVQAIIYIVRNPLDVAVSFARYSDRSLDETINNMADPTFSLSGDSGSMSEQLRQDLSSWSRHVASWADCPHAPVHVVRYEDMQHQSVAAFTAVAEFAGQPATPERISAAISDCAFEKLQRQEHLGGFKEKISSADRFFRKGAVGAWRTELTGRQVRRIHRDHEAIMRRFGYFAPDGAEMET